MTRYTSLAKFKNTFCQGWKHTSEDFFISTVTNINWDIDLIKKFSILSNAATSEITSVVWQSQLVNHFTLREMETVSKPWQRQLFCTPFRAEIPISGPNHMNNSYDYWKIKWLLNEQHWQTHCPFIFVKFIFSQHGSLFIVFFLKLPLEMDKQIVPFY